MPLFDPAAGRDGVHLKLGAAPSLPQEYNQAIGARQLRASVRAAQRRIARKRLLSPISPATRSGWIIGTGLNMGCVLLVTPIMDAQSQVLGTFAIYHPETYIPTRPDFKLIERATNRQRSSSSETGGSRASKTDRGTAPVKRSTGTARTERTADRSDPHKAELATDAAGLGMGCSNRHLIWDAQMHCIYGVSP